MFKSIKNLKEWYVVFLETGLILALLIFLSAFTVEIQTDNTFEVPEQDKDTIKMIDIPITEDETPPAPLKPSVIAEVPDDELIEEDLGELDIVWEPDDYIAAPEGLSE